MIYLKSIIKWRFRFFLQYVQILSLFVLFVYMSFAPIYVKANDSVATKDEFIQIVYEKMARQEETIVVNYKGSDYKEIHEQFLDKILTEDIYTIDRKNTSDDADYMVYNLEKIEIHTRTELIGNAKFTLNLVWKENKKQVKQVNKKVKQIVKELNLDKDSNYIKVKKIHDYIIDHVSYDNSLTSFTTYDALFKEKATCQGYMLLVYKLVTEAGIDCKCIDGEGISQDTTESHGWNIIKLGDKWYNMDATWDDPVVYREDGSITEDGKKEFQYDYFLKGSKNFDKRHVMNQKFKTKEFRKKYPISVSDFSQDMYNKWLKKHNEQSIQESEQTDFKIEETEQKKEKNEVTTDSGRKFVNLALIALTVLFSFRTIKLFFYK